MDREALVTPRRLPLGARQGVFFARLGMQEHRKVLSNRSKAETLHLTCVAANHNVVVILHRQPEELVPHRTTHAVDLHRCGPALTDLRARMRGLPRSRPWPLRPNPAVLAGATPRRRTDARRP